MRYRIDTERAARVAATRESGKLGYASRRPLSEGFEAVGVAGEIAFSLFGGMKVDEKPRSRGDKGVDFRHSLTIDVKTARRANNLIVEVGKVKADLYVLCEWDDATETATLLGWAWGWEVSRWPVDDGTLFKNGIRNHYRAASALHPMAWLARILGRTEVQP